MLCIDLLPLLCYNTHIGGDLMKKILFTLGVIIFVFGTLFCSGLGIYSFNQSQNQTYNMQNVKVCITTKEEWQGRNPSLTLYTKDANRAYDIPSVWYNKFDIDVFNENFISGKEYVLIINYDEIVEDSKEIFVYGMADEHQEYLSSEDAISADKSNSIWGLIIGLSLLIGMVVLITVIFVNIKSVVAFLKEFYN